MNEKHIVTLYKGKNKKSKVLFFWKKDIESNNIFYIYVTPEIPKFDEYNFINLRDRSERGKFSFLLHQTEHLRQTSAARYFSLANDRDNPSVSKRRGRIPLLFPRDYEDPLSRVYIRKKEEGRVGPIGLFIFVPITVARFQTLTRFSRARLLKRFLLKRRSQGRVRQDNVINYGASKPPRAFICTALALSLAPLLIFLVEEGYRPSQTSPSHAYSWLQINNQTFGIQFW